MILEVLQEWIFETLGPDSCTWPVAGNDGDFIGEGEEAFVNGVEKLAGVASGQVGAAYGAGEEGVSG